MLPKAYDPKAVEDRIYKMWEESGVFRADVKSDKEPFTISMPPPNATGQLHVGNAMMLALEDIFIRFQRMRGREALWVPGTDHAAIATESFVIRKLQKEEKMRDPRGQLGRENLVKEIRAFVEQSKQTIRSQIRKMGASCDWSRERYTMEPALNRIVNEVFVKMYRDGLIYRGHRIVNWDPTLQTTVSDDEIVYEERKEPFYTFQYGPFRIGTSRPETKFGDKYVVMHPEDKRYAQYTHGEQIQLEWINGPITATIIKDKAVDPEFGTGVMTITPWHDHVDFEIAEHHKLDKEQIIGFDGKLLPIAGEFSGMHIEEARPKIVEKLQAKGLLVDVNDDYIHNVALSQRGKGTIEPQIKEQWFIDVNKRVVHWKRRELSLKEVMQEVVKTKLITIIPDRFVKTYFHWIDHLRDWCISRQIWWGHRVPVWYRNEEGSSDMHVGVQPPKGGTWTQDPDTLDTWFSSALWTWSTLIDPKLTEDFDLTLEDLLLSSPDIATFHPTDVLETGYDILFFWVARMILMTTYVTGSMSELEYGQVPFDTVYLHGLIRDREGRKMSKSHPETNIDPLDMIAKYGADALRMAMIVGQSPGNDFRLYEEKIAGYRNFVNKLWNASRFVLMKCEAANVDPKGLSFSLHHKLSFMDRVLLKELNDLIDDVTEGLQYYRLSGVGERLYSFVWDFFCDWYLELSKQEANPSILLHALRVILTLLHPYCPFVTEEIFRHIGPQASSLLMKQNWPEKLALDRSFDLFERFFMLQDAIKKIREMRSDYQVSENEKPIVYYCSAAPKVASGAPGDHDLMEMYKHEIIRLCHLKDLLYKPMVEPLEKAAVGYSRYLQLRMPLGDIIDVSFVRNKAIAEEKKLYDTIQGLKKKLSDKKFMENAPPDVIDGEKKRLFELNLSLENAQKRIQILS